MAYKISLVGSRIGFRRIFALLGALIVVSQITSCGGGAVTAAPATVPASALLALPSAVSVFPQATTTFTISGGTAAYSVFSSDSATLPVTAAITGTTFTAMANAVAVDTPVTLTVRDIAGATTAIAVTVKAAVLSNTVTLAPIAPTGTGCGTGGICSGGDAQVKVTASLNGVALAGRDILFSTYVGNFQFVTPQTGALVNALTIKTDASGAAVATVRAAVAAPTQSATLTTTDVVSGLVRFTNFTILQQNNGAAILTVLPSGTVAIKGAKGAAGATKGDCPSGASADYYVFGGSPPYTISSTFPTLFAPSPTVVGASGGLFRVTVNGCGTSTISIRDSLQRIIETATITAVEGDAGAAAAIITTPTVTPTPITLNDCTEKVTVSLGGTAPFTTTVAVGAAAITVVSGTGVSASTATINRTAATAAFAGPAIVNFSNSVGTAPLTVNLVGAGNGACP